MKGDATLGEADAGEGGGYGEASSSGDGGCTGEGSVREKRERGS